MSGEDPREVLSPAAGDAEPGDHLVEHQQRAVLRGAIAQQLEEALVRRRQTHVGGIRLGQECGELVLVGGADQGLAVVPRDDDGRGGGGLGHAGTGREAGRRQAAPRLGQQPVDVSVVGAGELEQLGAAGRCTGKTDRAHRRLRARRRHPQHLHRRDPPGDLDREVDLTDGRRAEGRAPPGCGPDRVDDRRVRVAVDQRAPRAHVVDEAVAVDVDELGALGPVHEQRIAADRAHRPDRGVDAPRQVHLRPLVLLGALRVSEGDAHVPVQATHGQAQTPACSRSQFLKSSVK